MAAAATTLLCQPGDFSQQPAGGGVLLRHFSQASTGSHPGEIPSGIDWSGA